MVLFLSHLFGRAFHVEIESIAKAGARSVTISARNKDAGEKAAARLAEHTPSCQAREHTTAPFQLEIYLFGEGWGGLLLMSGCGSILMSGSVVSLCRRRVR